MIPRCTILIGDVRVKLRTLPENSFQCVVTSPPYWAQRNYETEPQIWGGTVDCPHKWVNAGRIHKGGSNGAGILKKGNRCVVQAQDAVKDIRCGELCTLCGAWLGELGLEPSPKLYVQHIVEVFREVHRVLRSDGTCWVNLGDSHVSTGMKSDALKSKDQVGIPWRVAFALQEEGWFLRQDIIWHKTNPMPESVQDRCTKSHEYVFLLSKSKRYFYNAGAIKEPVSGNAHPRISRDTADLLESDVNLVDGQSSVPGVNPKASKVPTGWNTGKGRAHTELAGRYRPRQNESFSAAVVLPVNNRNKRSVWSFPTEAYSGAHYATFPRALARPCILAGSRPGDAVLDPFGGSGTTAEVALEYGRNATLIDLDPGNEQLMSDRAARFDGHAVLAIEESA